MSDNLKKQARALLEIATAFVPWPISMFVLYWLQYGEIWTTETAHRGKISVAILALGMVLSFLVHSYFAGQRRQP